MLNPQLLLNSLAFIESNPEHWDQNHWHCGTTHCLAGVVQCLGLGLDPKLPFPRGLSEKLGLTTYQYAVKVLGITPTEGHMLFDEELSLSELRNHVEDITNGSELHY